MGKLKKGVLHREDVEQIWSYYLRTCTWHCTVCSVSLTLWNPMDCSSSGSFVHGIFPSRTLEWAATSSSRGSCWHRDRTCVSRTGGFFTTGTPGKPRAYINEEKNQHTEMAARARQEGHSSRPLRSLQGVIMPL